MSFGSFGRALDELAGLLAGRDVRCERGEHGLTVPAADASGFDVALLAYRPAYIVCLGGWNDTFEDLAAALRLATLGLTRDCRVRVESRGGRPFAWAVERRLAGNAWAEIGEASHLSLRFWQPRRTRYLHNRWLEAPSALAPGTRAVPAARLPAPLADALV